MRFAIRSVTLIAAMCAGCGARSDLGVNAVERCNGVDDDGDGAIDEGIEDLVCGVGACAASAPGCVGGKPGRCTPLLPGQEVCNQIDDDCDGATDEDLAFGLVSGPHRVGEVFAMGRAIEATATGVLAVWSIGFDGSNPTPNTFGQALDDDGRPIGPRQQLLVDPVVDGPALASSTEGRLAVSMCRRFGFEDRPSWLFVDPSGAPVAAEHAVADPRVCGTFDTVPQMLWTDHTHLFVWMTSVPAAQLVLEKTDATGQNGVTELLVDGADLYAPARFARHGERVAVIAGLQPSVPSPSELGVVFLDLLGTEVGERVVLGDPGGTGYLQPRVAVAPDGVMLVVAKHRFGAGWIRARVSFDGTVVEAPVLLPEELTLRSLEAREGGGFWAAGELDAEGDAYLFQLDATGNIVEAWPLPEPAWRPELAQRNGRIYLLYDAALTTQIEPHSAVFGCVD